jgi:hypothetical protein
MAGQMNSNGSGRKQSYLSYYPGHFHGQTEKTTKKPVMRASVLAIITTSNQSPFEYSSRALPLHQPLLGAFLILYMMDPASEAVHIKDKGKLYLMLCTS